MAVLDLRCCVCAFFSWSEWGLPSQLWCVDLSLWWLLLLGSLGTRSRRLWHTGLVAPWRVEASWTPGIVSPCLLHWQVKS